MSVCAARTSAGRACRNHAAAGGAWCGPHRDQLRRHTITLRFRADGWLEVRADTLDPDDLEGRLLDWARMLATDPAWAVCFTSRCGEVTHVG